MSLFRFSSANRWTCHFSCALDGSTSLWLRGSASVRHFLAGLSCATSAACSATESTEPFLSWLGALGLLQPLESLSGTGGGASLSGWEGPLDRTPSGLTGLTGTNWEESIGWFVTPVKTKKKDKKKRFYREEQKLQTIPLTLFPLALLQIKRYGAILAVIFFFFKSLYWWTEYLTVYSRNFLQTMKKIMFFGPFVPFI